MNIVRKMVFFLIGVIFPGKWKKRVKFRAEKVEKFMTSTPELRIFWKIIFFPITLVFSLLFAIVKSFFVIILPEKTYGNMSYNFQQLFLDISTRGAGLKTAIIRFKLRHELFTKGDEKRKSFGEENPDLTFYVIRPYYFLEPNELIYRNVANLLTQYYYVLQKLSYAVENGWIPVVDWENYGKLPHAEDYPVNGTCNSWEYYWTQPSKYTLDEVYKSKNVILSTQNIGQFGYIPNCSMAPPYTSYAKRLVDLCPQYSYLIKLNEITQKYVDEAKRKYFPEQGKVLGVVVRGASYGRIGTPYHSHPRQVSIKELIKSVRNHIEEWEIDYIFFVNEMQELVDEMYEAFGDKLIVLPRMRDTFDRPNDGIVKNPMYYDGNRYQTNLDYVTEIALLAQCDSIMGSMSSGMRTALIWNENNYEHTYVFEKGLW